MTLIAYATYDARISSSIEWGIVWLALAMGIGSLRSKLEKAEPKGSSSLRRRASYHAPGSLAFTSEPKRAGSPDAANPVGIRATQLYKKQGRFIARHAGDGLAIMTQAPIVMRRRHTSSAALALFITCLPFFSACAAPTLPLPPPSALVSAPDEGGIATVTGMGRPSAVVMVFNENSELGVIVVADDAGNYVARIHASGGDTLTMWQMVGSQTSPLLSREVPFPGPI